MGSVSAFRGEQLHRAMSNKQVLVHRKFYELGHSSLWKAKTGQQGHGPTKGRKNKERKRKTQGAPATRAQDQKGTQKGNKRGPDQPSPSPRTAQGKAREGGQPRGSGSNSELSSQLGVANILLETLSFGLVSKTAERSSAAFHMESKCS